MPSWKGWVDLMKQFSFGGKANDSNLLHYYFPDNFGNLFNSSFFTENNQLHSSKIRQNRYHSCTQQTQLIIEFMIKLVDKRIQRNKHYHKIGQQKKNPGQIWVHKLCCNTKWTWPQNNDNPPKKNQFITDHLFFPLVMRISFCFKKSYLFFFNSNFNGFFNEKFLPLALNSNHFIFARCRSSFTQSLSPNSS